MRHLLLALILTVASLSAPARADVICDWVDMAGRAPDGRALPPLQQDQVMRSAPSLVALTMFEVTNSVDPRYVSYLSVARAAPGIDARAAAVAGAHAVLVHFRPDQRAMLDQAMAVSLASFPDDPARAASLAWGETIAAAVLKRTLFEGPEADPYRPVDTPGRFAPPIPPVITAWALRAQPYFLKSFDEVMPVPPPPLTSARYTRDFNETKTIGGVGQPGATPAARLTATFLSGFNVDGMIHVIADAKPRLVDRARLWALVRMAQHDANAMMAVSKMRYMTWRPFNAIRNADQDGNPATERDPTWEPVLPTPNHPEYPCGHCIASAVIADILSAETPGPVTVASDAMPMPITLTYPDWPAFLAAAALARIQGGMHFRFSAEAGQKLGHDVGELAKARFAPRARGRGL